MIMAIVILDSSTMCCLFFAEGPFWSTAVLLALLWGATVLVDFKNKRGPAPQIIHKSSLSA